MSTDHLIKIAIADDHKIFRDGIKMALSGKENLKMLWEAEDGKDMMHKIAIKKPEVLLMDEATSSLDTNSERIVKEVIDNFKSQGKTVIVIAHRLSTIANADTILVMENGTIVESGNHIALLEQKGKYYDLWNKQGLV